MYYELVLKTQLTQITALPKQKMYIDFVYQLLICLKVNFEPLWETVSLTQCQSQRCYLNCPESHREPHSEFACQNWAEHSSRIQLGTFQFRFDVLSHYTTLSINNKLK